MLYLAYLDGEAPRIDTAGPWREIFLLKPGLLFVDSDQRRSVVYHALKDHVPEAGGLLVITVTEVPKFKGMAPGALAWARSRAPRLGECG